MSLYNIFSLLIVLAAFFAFINHRYLKFPATIGIMVISIVSSLILIVAGYIAPQFINNATDTISKIDFENVLMNAMLSFMLFAGSINLNIHSLSKEKIPVLVFATFGVLISTFIIGTATYYGFYFFAFKVDYIYCLLFGALISPTDPIAVLGILKEARIPKSLEVKITGESLINDGIAVVIFMTLFEISRTGIANLSIPYVTLLFLREAGGGIVYGLAIGYAGYLMLKSIDNYKVEVFITLALVMGGYSLASYLHISGPLSMVVAGLIIGNQGTKFAMSETTKEYLYKFWEIVDDLLNAILFTLIGFEILIINIKLSYFLLGIAAFVIVLIARYLSVGASMLVTRFNSPFERRNLYILTWGGLRGGISVALALSLGVHMERELFVAITYVVVLLSVLFQGLTIGKVARKLSGKF